MVQFAWVLLPKLASYLSSETISGHSGGGGRLNSSSIIMWVLLISQGRPPDNIEKWPHLNGRRFAASSLYANCYPPVLSQCRTGVSVRGGGELVTVLLLVVGDEWSNIIVNRAVLGQQKVQTREGSSHLIGALMTEGMFDFIIKYRITSTTLHSSTHCTRRIKGPVVLWPRDNYPHLCSVSSFCDQPTNQLNKKLLFDDNRALLCRWRILLIA